MLPILDEMLSPGSVIASTFRRMAIAEEEVAKVPGANDSFKYLCPSQSHVAEAPDQVYRAHCAELARRFVKQGDMRLPTQAEMAWTMCQISMAAPLRPEWAALYAEAFTSLHPEHANVAEPLLMSDRWTVDQARIRLVNKLTVKDRGR